MHRVLAGLIAAVPLAVAAMGYVLLRGNGFVDMLRADADFAVVPEGRLRLMAMAALVFGAFFLGVMAGLVYGFVPSRGLYIGLAIGLAVAMSVAALVSRTPMAVDKVVINFVVAAVLGFLVPRLAL